MIIICFSIDANDASFYGSTAELHTRDSHDVVYIFASKSIKSDRTRKDDYELGLPISLCFVVVVDPTYEATEMSTGQVPHSVYTELAHPVYSEIAI